MQKRVLRKMIAAAMALSITVGTSMIVSAVDTSELGALSNLSSSASELGGLSVPLTNEERWKIYSGEMRSVQKQEWGDFYYQTNEDNTVSIIFYNGTDVNVTVPGEIDGKPVTKLNWGTFYQYTSLKSVTLPNTLTTINGGFHDCFNLTEINIPKSVTDIQPYSFSGCTSLKSINVDPDNSVYSSQNGVLFNKDRTQLIMFPQGKEGDYVIPDSVKTVYYGAFRSCAKMTGIVISEGMTEINNYMFENCIRLKSVTLSESIGKIKWGAFQNCESLTEIDIPKNVDEINVSAFENCKNLTSINVDSENVIYSSQDGVLFSNHNRLMKCPSRKAGKYVIPDGIQYIHFSAFDNCADLTEIVIPDSAEEIGNSAFRGCSGLENITIPKNVTKMGNDVFWNCTNLENIHVDPENKTFSSINGVVFGKDGTELISCPAGKTGNYTIPDSVVTVQKSAFYQCEKLTDIIIPNSVKNIQNSAFYGCRGLTSVTVPDSAGNIGYNAFAYCENLKSVVLSKNAKVLNAAFYHCTNLTDVTIPDGVTTIKWGTFMNCSALKNITLPKSVNSIDTGAFSGCTTLQNISVENGNAAFSSVNGVLFNRNQTAVVMYPKARKDSYTIPSTVTSVGESAFSDCVGLTSIQIPNSVRSVAAGAFRNCQGLTSVLIPGSVTSIGNSAFSSCKNLKNVTLEAGVTTIGQYAFYHCENLTSIKIPDSVKSIDSDSFSQCKEIKIEGVKNSYAEAFANENNIPFAEWKKLVNTSVLSATNITLGQKITVKANSSGGTGSYQYQVVYKQTAQTKWTTAQAFNANDTVTFKPAKPTTYDVCVKVKDNSGTIIKKFFKVNVAQKLENTSTLSAVSIQLGNKITAKASATGGVGSYQYQVVYKQTVQTKWTTAQAFNSNATVTFKPAKKTTYDVCVKVKDNNGTISKKFFTVTVK